MARSRRSMFAIVIAVLLAEMISPASAAWRWPWESQRVHHRRQPPPPALAPDCAEINAAVKVLDGRKLERALRASNRKQRKTIDDCAKAEGGAP